ncbi:MAG: hypothetical protein ACI8QS_003316 [Planctomycetota bacterium]|jgi:hypothetical protein
MPGAIQYDASDRASLVEVDCPGLHEEIFDGAEESLLRVRLHEFEGELELAALAGIRRSLLNLEGHGLRMQDTVDGPSLALRPLEPRSVSSQTAQDWDARISGAATLLELQFEGDQDSLEIIALRLGERSLRESLRPGYAYLLAHAGSLRARVTDEEDPFELEPGESLWLQELEGEEELEIIGTSKDLVVVLAQLRSDRR